MHFVPNTLSRKSYSFRVNEKRSVPVSNFPNQQYTEVLIERTFAAT